MHARSCTRDIKCRVSREDVSRCYQMAQGLRRDFFLCSDGISEDLRLEHRIRVAVYQRPLRSERESFSNIPTHEQRLYLLTQIAPTS